MSLIKWNPENSVFPNASTWFDDFFNDSTWLRPLSPMRSVSIPAVNVKETEQSFKLEVAAPGFKKEDFKLEVKNGALLVSGEARSEKEEKEESFTRREFSYNQFSRAFALPENVKNDEIGAEYTDGILKITLPKTLAERAPSKMIAVK